MIRPLWGAVLCASTQDETGQFRLLSDKGIIFQPELSSFQVEKVNKTALFFGPEMSEKKVFKTCIQLNENLKKLNDASGSYSSTIKQCGMNERRSWLVTLDSGVIIKLGKEKIMQQLERFIERASMKKKHKNLVISVHPDLAAYLHENDGKRIDHIASISQLGTEFREDNQIRVDEFRVYSIDMHEEITELYGHSEKS